MESSARTLRQAISRFPFPVAAAVIGTCASLPLFEALVWRVFQGALAWTDGLQKSLTYGAAAAFLGSFAIGLAAQRASIEPNRRLLFSGIAFTACFILVGFLRDVIPIYLPYIYPGLILAVSTAGLARRDGSEDGFWNFNHQVWLNAAVALAAACIFSPGIAAILETIRYLFAAQVGGYYGFVMAIGFGLIGPLTWLALSLNLDAVPELGTDVTSFISRDISALTKYLLVPLLLIYAVVLHVYAAKIALGGTLPKGQIGWIVLSYSASVAVTALLAYPNRETGRTLVTTFWRCWPYLLAVPVLLLFLAIHERISQYGLTQDRYFVVLAGLWLTSLIVTQGLIPNLRDIRFIPASLAAILLVTSFGPWSARELSIRLQFADLKARLEAAGRLKDGHLIETAGQRAFVEPDKSRIVSAIDYLGRQKRYDLLQSFSPDDKSSDRPEVLPGWNLRKQLGIEGDYRPFVEASKQTQVWRNYHASSVGIISTNATAQLIGPLNYTKPRGTAQPTNDRPVQSKIDGNTFVVTRTSDGATAEFDFSALWKRLADTNKPSVRAPIEIIASAGLSGTKLLVMSANGLANTETPEAFDMSSMQYWVLWPAKE